MVFKFLHGSHESRTQSESARLPAARARRLALAPLARSVHSVNGSVLVLLLLPESCSMATPEQSERKKEQIPGPCFSRCRPSGGNAAERGNAAIATLNVLFYSLTSHVSNPQRVYNPPAVPSGPGAAQAQTLPRHAGRYSSCHCH